MKRLLFVLLVACSIYGQQQKYVAIINTVDDGDMPVNHSELNYLTDRLREIAVKNLPQKDYAVMTQQSIVAFLGSMEETAKKCRESEGCLAKLGREINADYIGQGRIGRFGGKFTIKVEVYDVRIGNLISSFTGSAKDIHGLLSILDKEAVNMFKKISIGAEQEENTIIDSRDGKKYKTVKIGSQVWMAENLNYNISGSTCFDEKQENCDKYGRFYNWTTAMNVCPSGWHLPDMNEWGVLVNFAGGEDVAGKHLKATRNWNAYEGKSNYETDRFGFTALPTNYAGISSTWWSATEGRNASRAYGWEAWTIYDKMLETYTEKNYFHSVRCVKD